MTHTDEILDMLELALDCAGVEDQDLDDSCHSDDNRCDVLRKRIEFVCKQAMKVEDLEKTVAKLEARINSVAAVASSPGWYP